MSDINNKDSHIQNQYNYSNVFSDVVYQKDPERPYLSFHPAILKQFLDRSSYINQIKELFEKGANIVVVHGESGKGKTALANEYFHSNLKYYEQVGWVKYELNIHKSIVGAFDSHNTELSGRKSDNLYYQLAGSEMIFLKNNPKKRLVVLDDVQNWDEVFQNISYFQLETTHFLITSHTSFGLKGLKDYEIKVKNYKVPEIGKKEIFEIFGNLKQGLNESMIQKLNNNLYLTNLLIAQAPSQNSKLTHDFFAEVFNNSKNETDILLSILKKSNLTNPEKWILLQLGALPIRPYDADDLNDLLIPEHVEGILEINNLKGFNYFDSQYFEASGNSNFSIEGITRSLVNNGWLIAFDYDQFEIQPILKIALKKNFQIDANYFRELSNNLTNSFFKELLNEDEGNEYSLIDDLNFENHLFSFIYFVPNQSSEFYLSVLEKLIVILRKSGRYVEEESWRLLHLAELRKSNKVQNLRIYRALVDIITVQLKMNKIEKAKINAAKIYELESITIDYSYYNIMGVIHMYSGNYFESKAMLEKAKNLADNDLKIKPQFLANIYSNLAMVLNKTGDYSEALKIFEKILDDYEKSPQYFPHINIDYLNFAGLLQNVGDYPRAKELLEKAITITERVHHSTHPFNAKLYSSLATVLYSTHDYHGAKILLIKAIESSEKFLISDHVTTAFRYSKLALVLQSLGEFNESKEFFKKAIESIKKNKEGKINIAQCYSNLAMVSQGFEDYESAYNYCLKSIELLKVTLPEGNNKVIAEYKKLDSIKANL